MAIEFTKMHGLGNDFVVIDAIRQHVELAPAEVRHLAHRRLGVGCDQVLLVEAPTRPGVDFRYRIFNADGGEVEQCGNGARCFARFVRDKRLTDRDTIVVETASGVIRPHIEADGEVTVDMGRPRFEPTEIPMLAPERTDRYLVSAGDLGSLPVGAVSMGNPHAVLEVEDVERAPVARLGPVLGASGRFPRGVNVGFMQVVDAGHIRLRVFERGVGETQACGTGACAAVCIGRVWGRLDERVAVDLPGGRLHVRWDGGAGHAWMRGPAVTVFEGWIEL